MQSQGLGQHRTIWQEHSAKDFASYESYKRAGILYVFPPFITARMRQKIGRRPQTQLCGDALGKILLNYAKDKRNKLYLNVYQKNARAISFYKREEFEIQHSGLDEATGEKDYVMTWQHK